MRINLLEMHGVGYSIQIFVNEVAMNFLIDTGCQKSLIFNKNANKLALSRSKERCIIKDSYGCSKAINEFVMVKKLKIANIVFTEMKFLLISDVSRLYTNNYDGIIGMDILSKINFCLNFKEKYMCVKEVAKCGDGDEYLMININNMKSTAILDTGARTSWISNKELLMDIPHKNRLVIHCSINSVKMKIEKEYTNIFLSGSCFSNIITILEGRSVFRKDVHIGVILGMDVLQDKIVKYQDGKWYLREKLKDNSKNVL